MTAEIVIMNKHSIALASDSAVTMIHGTSEKIKTSANKLFALSKYHPIGIMVFGNADLMEIPWETIIKIYRNKLGEKKFDSMKEYADDFIAFLDNRNPLFPESIQKEYLLSSVYGYFNFIKKEMEKEFDSVLTQKNEITQGEINEIISATIKKHYKRWKDADIISSIPNTHIKDIADKFGEDIDKAIDEVFQRLPITKHRLNQLKEIAASLFLKFPKDIRKEGYSGVVIAGFGEKDTFPSFIAYDIDGVVNDRLKYRESSHDEISFESDASVTAFAQKEMVVTFMEGIDPYYMEAEQNYLFELFNEYTEMIIKYLMKENDKEKERIKKKLQKSSEGILIDHLEKLKTYRQERHINPVTSVVSMLPKDELATMAETLVNLTSFARKVKLGPETVGGPIDVAVISKGDGFIWIKRKHYFKAELNPQFFAKYYKEEFGNGDKIEK
ncbi:Uncharacterised protein [uncultured archaeon]|nr:Uncharacterised protein [uncultured archaeon]